MNYQQSLNYLYNRLPVFHISGGSAYKPGLDNTIRLLAALNNPHRKFKTIHIAGTNGKGSVSHMLAAVMQQSGYKTGLYTSPHLVDFGERIRINGIMINEDYVVQFVENYKDLVEQVQPSFFELTMAMAFSYFAHESVDIAIIETGLGGRLDSTNIITPELSIITNIGMDHTDFLGNTLSKIAYEKAGIIKSGIPVVIGEVLDETRTIFTEKASETKSKLIFAEEKHSLHTLESNNKELIVTNNVDKWESELTGNYQLKNIATLLAAIDELKFKSYTIPDIKLKEGLKNVCKLTGLRGRWEVLSEHPLQIADTGHNVDGINAVVKQLNNYTNRKHIVIGMVNDKDVSGVLKLLPTSATYYFTNAQVKRALPATELKKLAQEFNLSGNAYSTIKAAIEAARQSAGADGLILITGSNFVVGEALTVI
jgi:dihydrofolate synthase/folylpolyglutamate synthase